jgi:hypothetical protein
MRCVKMQNFVLLKIDIVVRDGIIDSYYEIYDVGIAQLVERCLAKAKVAGSNPVSHSILRSYELRMAGNTFKSMTRRKYNIIVFSKFKFYKNIKK